mgnify:CR=1 FL=1
MEFKGGLVIERLFDALYPYYVDCKSPLLNLLPEEAGQLIRQEQDAQGRARRLCDWISGLTDHAACKLYNTLFDPDKPFG